MLLASGCTGDNDDEPQMLMQVSAVTRSDQAQAVTTEGTSIHTYLTQENGDINQGYITRTAEKWVSTVSVRPNETYYIYGFSPSDIVSAPSDAVITSSGGFNNGAVLKLSSIEAVSTKDLCVIIGVEDVPRDNKDKTPDVKRGAFTYLGKDIGFNYVNVLLGHVYSSLSFTMKVDPTYNALRTIKLKKMELLSASAATYDLTITLAANTSNTNPITSVAPSNKESSSSDRITIYENTTGGLELTTEASTAPMTGYIIYDSGSSPNLSIRCTYDIYDKNKTTEHPDGNLIRQDCIAENKISLSISSFGQQQPVNITVNPTYLYVLSDPDLDNPTITLE